MNNDTGPLWSCQCAWSFIDDAAAQQVARTIGRSEQFAPLDRETRDVVDTNSATYPARPRARWPVSSRRPAASSPAVSPAAAAGATRAASAAAPGATGTLSNVAGAATSDVGSTLTSLGPQAPTTYGLTRGPAVIPGANGMVGSGVKLGASSVGALGSPPTSGGGGGLISRAMDSPLTPYALKLGGGIDTDYSKAKMLKATQQRQDSLEADARARYNSNNGTALWGPAPRG